MHKIYCRCYKKFHSNSTTQHILKVGKLVKLISIVILTVVIINNNIVFRL